MSKFTSRIQEGKKSSKENKVVNKLTNFTKISPAISIRLSKDVLEKSKFFKKNHQKKIVQNNHMLKLHLLRLVKS